MAVRGVTSFAPGGGTVPIEIDGAFTPTDASGAGLVYTTAIGFYRKIGKTCLIWGVVAFPVTANGAQASFGSLPFPTSNSGLNGWPSIALFGGPTASVGYVNKNTNTFSFGGVNTGVAVPNSTYSSLTVYFSGVYPLDA